MPNLSAYAARPNMFVDKEADKAAEAMRAEKARKKENMRAFWAQ